MKICFFGIYDPSYSRNHILLKGLRQAGVEVVECREDWRDPKRYAKLKRSLRALNNDYDLVYAAYPSPVPTIFARLISKKPVVVIAFYSMFDSVVNDRRKLSRWHPKALKLLILDWLGLMMAHTVIVDTEEHRKYWSKWWGVNSEKIHTVYLGINDDALNPSEPSKKDGILATFCGTYIPLQGATKIIEAAHLCADDPKISFRMIGDGRDFPKAKRLADQYKLGNVEFIGMIPPADLNRYLNESDIILGIFGDREKTQRVIPNKVYDGLAVGRAVITMDTLAMREIFSDEDLLMVKNDPRSIADGIKKLAGDSLKRAVLAKHGYDTVSNDYRPVSIARSLINIIFNRI